MMKNKKLILGCLLTLISVTAVANPTSIIKFVARAGDGSGEYRVVVPAGKDSKTIETSASIDCDAPAKIIVKGRKPTLIDQQKCLKLSIELADKISTHEVLVNLDGTFEASAKEMGEQRWSGPLNASATVVPRAKNSPDSKPYQK